ncbi:hypothetical protein DL96DRAFT_1634626 [Flagelloscypha sp. PMI_526]|nr:hypothetical protein DL96DRAFT_1634626 [Flagelloscypha sp. PMI_526]
MESQPVSVGSLVTALNRANTTSRYYLAGLFIYAMAYGPITIATFLSMRLLRRRKTSGSRILWNIILLEWVATTIRVTAVLTEHMLYFSVSHYMLNDGKAFKEQNTALDNVRMIIATFEQLGNDTTVILANAVLAWRAIMIYPQWKFLKFLLGFLLFGDAALRLATDISYWIDSDALIPFSNLTSVICTYLAFLTCLICLILIASKAYRIRAAQRIYSSSSGFKSTSPVRRVLYILVEWGILLVVMHLYVALHTTITTYDPAAYTPANFWAMALGTNLVLIVIIAHPALTALIIANDQSVIDNTALGNRQNGTLTTICFEAKKDQDTIDASTVLEDGINSVPESERNRLPNTDPCQQNISEATIIAFPKSNSN